MPTDYTEAPAPVESGNFRTTIIPFPSQIEQLTFKNSHGEMTYAMDTGRVAIGKNADRELNQGGEIIGANALQIGGNPVALSGAIEGQSIVLDGNGEFVPVTIKSSDQIDTQLQGHVSLVNPHLTTYNSLEGSKPPNDATHNSADSYLLDRTNHSGTQAISTIEGLNDALNSMAGGLTYKGTFDASTGVYPSGENGWYYRCSVAGTVEGTEYMPGDWAMWNGVDTFDKVDNTDQVSSFNGRTGAITLTVQDIEDTGFTGGGAEVQTEVITNFVAGSSVQLNSSSLPIIGIIETIYYAEEAL